MKKILAVATLITYMHGMELLAEEFKVNRDISSPFISITTHAQEPIQTQPTPQNTFSADVSYSTIKQTQNRPLYDNLGIINDFSDADIQDLYKDNLYFSLDDVQALADLNNRHYGISPLLIYAVMYTESSLGNSQAARQYNNPLGILDYSKGRNHRKFSSKYEAFAYFYYRVGFLMDSYTIRNIEDFCKVWYAGDVNAKTSSQTQQYINTIKTIVLSKTV